jgi:hypothetical protein
LLGPGDRDAERLEDAPLRGREPVGDDPLVFVGEAEPLEGGEDVAAGGAGGPALPQQPVERRALGERAAEVGLYQAEDEERAGLRPSASRCQQNRVKPIQAAEPAFPRVDQKALVTIKQTANRCRWRWWGCASTPRSAHASWSSPTAGARRSSSPSRKLRKVGGDVEVRRSGVALPVRTVGRELVVAAAEEVPFRETVRRPLLVGVDVVCACCSP